MFALPVPGTVLLVDYFGSGGQVGLQHTHNIYGAANTLRLTGSAITSYPMAQVEGRVDLRLLALELTLAGGHRSVWRNLDFAPGENGAYCTGCDRAGRRRKDPLLEKTDSTDRFAFAEARAALYLPLNDHVIATGLYGFRYEDRKPRSFDWINSDVHDGGWHQRFEANLFFKHRDFGAIAPYVQLLRLRRQGRLVDGWAGGFNIVTRPGIVRHDDILLLTFLIRPGDRYYGQHSMYSPVRALLIYRMQITL